MEYGKVKCAANFTAKNTATTNLDDSGIEKLPRVIWVNEQTDKSQESQLLSSRYEIEIVPNGKAALEAAHRQPPDLILDELNDLELLHSIRGDEFLHSIPVILISNYENEETRASVITAGAADYVVRPYNVHELIVRMEAHLSMNSLRASKTRLAIEIAKTQQLQRISSRMIEENNIEALCGEILEVAISIMNAEFSSLQILNKESDELHLLAWKNFHPESAEYWQKVRIKTGTSCSAALQHGKRIILPDINTVDFLKNTESLHHYRLCGINAVQSTPLMTREGKVLGMISTHWRQCYEPTLYELAFFDVLVRQIADVIERQLVQEALKEADRQKDEFLAVLAHELRNPLFPLKNALFLLQQDNPTFNNLQLVQMMERQVNHILRLVDDLLEISRITTGKIELRREPINLIHAINNAIETCKPLLESKQHQIMLSTPSEPIIVHADMVRMTQIFANLLNNAAKFTLEKDIITIKIARDNSNIVISIKDNGIGISKELLPKIFDMFTQEQHSIDSVQRGLGIGLAMVHNLIKLHKGTVKAFSAGLTLGSEFIISLPYEDNQIHDTHVKKSSVFTKQHSFINLRLLIVDDNPDVRDSLAMLLRIWKINVKTINNGQSALATLDEFNPHIILMDIGMPDMNGYEVAEKIRQNSQYDLIKLVALTGWNQEIDRIKSKTSGFDEHLGKPVDFDELSELLSNFFLTLEL